MPNKPTDPIDDDILGRLTWDRHNVEWQAKITLAPDHTVDLDTFDIEDGPTAVTLLRLAAAWLPVGDPAARRYAATVQLGNFNDGWRQQTGDAEPITPDGFAGRLRLYSVSVSEGGALTLWYDAGGMFTEHGVTVDVDAAGEFVGVWVE